MLLLAVYFETKCELDSFFYFFLLVFLNLSHMPINNLMDTGLFICSD